MLFIKSRVNLCLIIPNFSIFNLQLLSACCCTELRAIGALDCACAGLVGAGAVDIVFRLYHTFALGHDVEVEVGGVVFGRQKGQGQPRRRKFYLS